MSETIFPADGGGLRRRVAGGRVVVATNDEGESDLGDFEVVTAPPESDELLIDDSHQADAAGRQPTWTEPDDEQQDEAEAEVGATDVPAAEVGGDPRGNRFCRICYDDSDGGEMGFLFSPCLCAGSVAMVHVNCLNTWRSMSANANSAYSCDMCKYQYKIGRKTAAKLNFAQLIGHPWFSAIATFWILLVVVVVVGGVLELFPGYNEVVADIADLSFPTRILSSGVSAVGMAGFLVQMVVGTGFRMMYHLGGGDRRNGGGIMQGIMILVGICYTYYYIYSWVKSKVRDATHGGTMVILDVHGRVPGQPAPTPKPPRVVTEVD